MSKKYSSELDLIYGGSPQNQKESDQYANVLARGNYPVGLDGCFTVGISGGCGVNCFVYKEGGCEVADEFLSNNYKDMTDEEILEFLELYPQHNELYIRLKGKNDGN